MRGALLLALALLAPIAGAHALPLLPHLADEGSTLAPTLPELVNVVAPRGSALAAPSMSDYELQFTCPQLPGGLRPTPCPFRVIDTGDILGNPGLAVDPVVPGRIAFASLHGLAADDGGRLSREGQTHTTFTTLAFGQNWEDQPYEPPEPPSNGNNNVLGEDVHALIDRSRTLHVASLYSHREDNAWSTTIVTWKFDQEARRLDYGATLSAFSNRVTGGRIETLWLTELPDANTVVMTWRETAPPDRPLVVGEQNLTSWLAFATTAADSITPWQAVPDTLLLAPCERSTNPVGLENTVYVGCMNATTGALRMWSLDVSTLAVTDLGEAPIVGGDAKLATTPSGRMALLSVEAVAPPPPPPPAEPVNESRPPPPTPSTSVRAQLTIGEFGVDWGPVREIGEAMHNGTRPLWLARVNALHFSGLTDTLHLVYLEKGAEAGEPVWRKSLRVLDTAGHVVFDLDLDLRDKGDVFSGGGPSREEVFGDTRDSIIVVSGREYIAFADYGVVVFAELIEEDRRVLALAQSPPPPVVQPAPVVQAAALATTTGVTVGLVATAAAARLIVVHRANATGAGKGRR